jgi:ABC-type dipeptide/oligopeptide/nickel transport system permease subunit
MISHALSVWRYTPWLLISPALVLAVVSLSIMFLGDGLNDALNPRAESVI